MNCICGVMMFSYDGFWRCPHDPALQEDQEKIYALNLGPHTAPFVDHRLCQTVDHSLINSLRGYRGKSNLAGPVGIPGSRSKRQPWKAPAVRKGTLAEWEKFNYRLGRLQQQRGRGAVRFRGRAFSSVSEHIEYLLSLQYHKPSQRQRSRRFTWED